MVAAVNKRFSEISLGCCCLLLLAAASGCGSDEWPTTKKVRISVKADQPGTGYRKETYGAREGFDIVIANMAARALGKEPYFNDVASDARQTVIANDDADLVVATFSINDERLAGDGDSQSAVDFVGPYAKTQSGILVRGKEYPGTPKDVNLAGKRVCTWPGTTSGVTAPNAIDSRYTRVEGSDAGDCVRRLRSKGSGRVDAVYTDAMLLYGFTQEYDDLKVVDPGLGTFQYYGIALPKGHRDVCNKIKKALKKYIGSGAWDQDFKNSLKSIDKSLTYKPSLDDIDTYSCKNKVGRQS